MTVDLGDVGTPLANDLEVVLRVNFQYHREAMQLPITITSIRVQPYNIRVTCMTRMMLDKDYHMWVGPLLHQHLY